MKGYPAQPINAAHQFMLLGANPLTAGQGSLGSGELTWWLEARPSPVSRAYQLRIEFKQGDRPFVFVDGPDLIELADGRRLPHVYQQQPTQLCLYFPRTGEWRSHMRIDQTIVPWAVLWLFYFEEWLLSDDWKGGGIHPEIGVARRDRSRGRQSHAG